MIFVDVDDTLVLWDDSKGVSTDYKFNERLASLVVSLRARTGGDVIVVWSGGGTDYARHWGRRALRRYFSNESEFASFVLATAKDPRFPSRGDIVIDDQPIETKGTHYTWQEFVERCPELLLKVAEMSPNAD